MYYIIFICDVTFSQFFNSDENHLKIQPIKYLFHSFFTYYKWKVKSFQRAVSHIRGRTVYKSILVVPHQSFTQIWHRLETIFPSLHIFDMQRLFAHAGPKVLEFNVIYQAAWIKKGGVMISVRLPAWHFITPGLCQFRCYDHFRFAVYSYYKDLPYISNRSFLAQDPEIRML